MSYSKTFITNTILTLSRQITSILLGLLSTIIIARVLGPEGNGMYQLIVLLPTTLNTLLNLGFGTSSVYYIGQKRYQLINIIRTNTITGFFISITGILIGFIIVFFFSDELFDGVPQIYLYSILAILPLLLINDFYLMIFQGVQDFKSYNSLALIRQLVALISLTVFLFLFDIGIVGTVLAFSIGVISQFLITLYLLRNRLQLNIFKGKFSKEYFKNAFSFGFKAHFSNVLSFLNYRADMYIISFFLNPAAVGLYGVAVNISERLWIISQSISSVLYPAISSSNNVDNKNRLTSTISRNVFFFSILGGIVFFLISDFVIRLLFGTEYHESSMILKLLLPGIILFSVDRILSNDLAGRGKPELNMYTSIFTVISNLLLNILLIPAIGLSGAAISTSVTYTLSTIIKMILFKRQTGLNYSKFIILQKEDFLLYKEFLKKVRRK